MIPGSGSSYKNYSQALSSGQNYSTSYEKASPSTIPPPVTTASIAPPKHHTTSQAQSEPQQNLEKKLTIEPAEIKENPRENALARESPSNNNPPAEVDPEVLQLEKEKRERRERMERIERLIAREQGIGTAPPPPETSQATPVTAPPTPAGANTAAKSASNISPEKVPGPFRSLVESTA